MATAYEFKTNRVSPKIGVQGNTTCPYGMTQAEANTLYKDTTLDGLVTILGKGYQVFEVPATGMYEIHCAGAQGGSTGTTVVTNPKINFGGRGALLKGKIKLTKGQKLYILVGQSGFTNTTADYGGGGGGASAVFLESEEGKYTFTPAGKKIIPLIVSGGGAGRTDSSRDTVDDISIDTNAMNAKWVNGTTTNAGSTSGASGGGGLTGTSGGGSCGKPGYSILSGTALGACWGGGWGGGGSPWNGGGGGGGYSGGNAVDSWPSWGGTSWMDESVKELERGLVPHVQGPSQMGYVTLIQTYNPDKRILCRDSEGYKYFNSEADKWILFDNQSGEYTSQEYETLGIPRITNFNGLDLTKPVTWLAKSPSETEEMFVDGTLDGAVIKSNFEISTTVIGKFHSIAIEVEDTSKVDIRLAVSVDHGKTYKTYIDNDWQPIDIDNTEEFKTTGIEAQNLTTIPGDSWQSLNSSNMRFAFCVTEIIYTGNNIIRGVSLLVDMLGKWIKATHDKDFKYAYSSPSILEVTFLTANDYKVNYLDKYIAGV